MKKLLLGVSSALLVSFYTVAALAQTAGQAAETAGAGAGSNAFDKSMAAMLAAALAIGVAAFGGALGQARIGAAALEGIARNPGASGKLTTPMILGLALVESLVLYAFVIALMVVGKA